MNLYLCIFRRIHILTTHFFSFLCPSLWSTRLPSSGEEEICSILSCNMRIYVSFIYDVTPVLISGSRGL